MDEQPVERLQRALLDVFVRAMHRLLALEADHGVPAELSETRAGVGGIESVRLEALERWPRDQVDRARQENVAARELVLRARMARVVGAVDEPGFLAAVVGKALFQVENPDRLLPGRDQRHVLALAQLIGGGPPNGEGDRQRPAKPAGEAHVAQDGAVVGLAHESLERAVGADGEELEVGHHPGVERDPLERGGALTGVREGVAAKDPIDQPSAVGRNVHRLSRQS